MSKKKESYQSAMLELQEIVTQIESNAIEIDELSTQMKRAATLITFCQKKLRATEGEITTLFGDDPNG